METVHSADGTEIAFDRSGEGPPLVLVGGAFQDRSVEDLAAVIGAGGELAFVFGQSSGGALALETAARAVAIRALVVNEPPFTDGPTTEFAEHLEKLVEDGQPTGSGVSRTLGNAANGGRGDQGCAVLAAYGGVCSDAFP